MIAPDVAKYVIGSPPGIKKLFPGFSGIHGDKKVGIQQLAGDRRRARPLSAVVFEDLAGAGGAARVTNRSGPWATQGTHRGIPGGSTVRQRTGKTQGSSYGFARQKTESFPS